MSNSFNKWFDAYPCKDTWSADDMLASYQAATAAADAEWRSVVDALSKTLRSHCITTSYVEGTHGNMAAYDHECINCNNTWKHGEPEKHDAECLAQAQHFLGRKL